MNMPNELDGFAGTLIGPDDAGYDQARRVWNGAIDRRPALIAGCANESDAARALAHARALGLPVSVRGGGHNIAGSAISEGGIVIDFSALHRVEIDSPAPSRPGAPCAGSERSP
ncbi:MAG TPA: FAD-binding protein, partial [Candidatus Acidoferrum sp.]|nr:FAD-binding protein [Candidatus Acidoferrum sp.]